MTAMKRRALLACLFLTMATSLSGQAMSAAPAVTTVGIVDFYAPTPLGSFGFVPERFAASALSDLLDQTGAGRFTVTSRESMERAEASLGWQSADVFHFDRLRALAQAVGANSLVVGWIPLLAVRVGGGGGGVPPNGGGPMAETNLVLQVFDAEQGRLVAETRHSAYAIVGTTRDLLAKQVLHDALVPALPPLVSSLTAGSR
jgi:hypothetical protein